jgi:NMD protein affecting ribosome stability and mRNA decay
MTRKSKSPRWTKSRLDSRCHECRREIKRGDSSRCHECRREIKRGDSLLYIPREKKVLCRTCGKATEPGEWAERSMESYGTDCALDY